MKEYNEVWSLEAGQVEEYFSLHPADVRIIPLPDKKIGPVFLPQTRIILKGDNAVQVYHQFLLRFLKGGG